MCMLNFNMNTETWAALIGALVGAGASLAGSIYTNAIHQRRADKEVLYRYISEIEVITSLFLLIKNIIEPAKINLANLQKDAADHHKGLVPPIIFFPVLQLEKAAASASINPYVSSDALIAINAFLMDIHSLSELIRAMSEMTINSDARSNSRSAIRRTTAEALKLIDSQHFKSCLSKVETILGQELENKNKLAGQFNDHYPLIKYIKHTA